MSAVAGTRLGPYEILSPLGAGGMGEVYRARDERLKRDVAVKVLPPELAADPERRTRFEREARAASALSHPNILTIYDVGSQDSSVYIAMELVEGGTLKDLIASGPVPVKKLLDLSVQVADGLSAAHAAGIVHRDLKPANVMVSKHGYVKILDFGLAKLVTPEDREVSGLQTAVDDPTRPGLVMGTVGYMSPEQAAGRPIDYRSDQFSFGSIVYEMATGQRAFERATTAETLTAIIREEPQPVSLLNPKVPAPVRWLVERCLQKDPEDRFGTTKDLARDLADVRDHLSEAAISATTDNTEIAAAAVRADRRRWVWPVVAIALAIAAAAGGLLAGKRLWHHEPPSFKQLTFRRGQIASARFAPDGQTILYSAAWDGNPMEIYVSRPESPESRPFGLPGAEILAVSRSGEMALSVGRHSLDPFLRVGTLARLSVAGGGAPREILNDIEWADWSPDGKELAIVRESGGAQQLEYPIGKVLYRTAGWMANMRVSPKGDYVAFLDHPARRDDGGTVDVVDRAGTRKSLTAVFSSGRGLAWSPDGREVWYTASKTGGNRSLFAVDLKGGERTLTRVTGNLALHDVAPDGRLLITQDVERLGDLGKGPGDERERELTWLDWSLAGDLSPDGRTLLFSESGEGGGPGYSVYVRQTDGSPAVRIGTGSGLSLSPDGKWALAISGISGSHPEVVLYPLGAGDPKKVPFPGINVQRGVWMPDGKRIFVTAAEPGHGPRLYVQSVDGGTPRAISPEGYRNYARSVSSDGKVAVVRGPDQRLYLYPIDGGEPVPVPGATTADEPTGWTDDGKAIWVFRRAELPAKVARLDVATGRRELWKELVPADAAGVTEVTQPL
ncbi:MAG TPA: protein kinase, partial [Thermoanaerobaculia bacterium]|nr:protein kinase [Thermoanaerobaculia bacterium]